MGFLKASATVVPPASVSRTSWSGRGTQAGIDHSEWEALAEDREEWRGTIKTAADNFEEGRKTAAAEKRQRRKDSASQPVTDTTFTCPSCSRACRSRIGLHSHQRACRRVSTSSQWSSDPKKPPYTVDYFANFVNAKCPSSVRNFSTLSVNSLAFHLDRESCFLVLPGCLISRAIIHRSLLSLLFAL